jgi:HEPN domain-containing protein
MRWARGRDAIDRLIGEGELERVTPSGDVAARLFHDAAAHLELARVGIETDPSGALQLSYDAARKAAAALLAIQGLRSTTKGGHIAVLDAVRAQFDSNDKVFEKVNRLRRRRNATEYPKDDSPTISRDDAKQAISTARTALEAAHRLVDTGELEPY